MLSYEESQNEDVIWQKFEIKTKRREKKKTRATIE